MPTDSLMTPGEELTIDLPSFIRPIPPLADAATIEFCKKKTAFDIPDGRIVKALLQSYFDFVNPFLPLFNKEEVYRMLEHGSGTSQEAQPTPQLSLLVFQALLFAGSGFVDTEVINAMGFDHRDQARRVLYTRACHLCDLGLETNGISLLQALLLFTLWVDIDELKGPWYWLCAAISHAQSIDLYGMLRQQRPGTPKYRHLRRLYWCCYIRETTVAQGMKCASPFRPASFHIPMLTLDDLGFSTPRSNGATTTAETATTLWPEAKAEDEKLRTLAMISVEFAKLCRHVKKMSILSGEQSGYRIGAPIATPDHSSADSVMRLAFHIRAFAAELSVWHKNLPQEVRCNEVNTTNVSSEDASLEIHKTVLLMSYYTATTDLYLPQVFPPTAKVHPIALKMSKFYRRQLLDAVLKMSLLGEHLTRLALANFSLIIRALVVFLSEYTRYRGAPKAEVVHGYFAMKQLLADIAQRYPPGRRFVQYFDRALQAFDASRKSNDSREIRSPTSQTGTAESPFNNFGDADLWQRFGIERPGVSDTLASHALSVQAMTGTDHTTRSGSNLVQVFSNAGPSPKGMADPSPSSIQPFRGNPDDVRERTDLEAESLRILLGGQLADAIRHHEGSSASATKVNETGIGQLDLIPNYEQSSTTMELSTATNLFSTDYDRCFTF
ncbi:hypothetical protein H2204_013041 [Knufia peltigerae]|uniref:Xylanolytic transcriptional activator regulatory domain-containing protein n=1 Tax=Knufia peltigerae TaxID=1002370 RepID=A0AA39CRP6_9EURO|nr:hypothetical protein H2204_013041 [Knufia peltigerae]